MISSAILDHLALQPFKGQPCQDRLILSPQADPFSIHSNGIATNRGKLRPPSSLILICLIRTKIRAKIISCGFARQYYHTVSWPEAETSWSCHCGDCVVDFSGLVLPLSSLCDMVSLTSSGYNFIVNRTTLRIHRTS